MSICKEIEGLEAVNNNDLVASIGNSPKTMSPSSCCDELEDEILVIFLHKSKQKACIGFVLY
jgi:hypothetical protein